MSLFNTATVHTYPVIEIAQAWRDHAQPAGVTDPDTQLLGQPDVRGGYRPAWYAPSTNELVIVMANAPHRTQAAAVDWLRWMLIELHQNGNITLYAESGNEALESHA